MKVLIVYYSTYGNVYRMATPHCRRGARDSGRRPVVRSAGARIHTTCVIDARLGVQAGRAMQQTCLWSPWRISATRVPTLSVRRAFRQRLGPTQEPNRSADVPLAHGSPGRLAGRCFCGHWQPARRTGNDAADAHGAPVHLGMILVGVPYSTEELFTTQGGGSPYGPGHVAGDDNRRRIDAQEAAICRALGRRPQ